MQEQHDCKQSYAFRPAQALSPGQDRFSPYTQRYYSLNGEGGGRAVITAGRFRADRRGEPVTVEADRRIEGACRLYAVNGEIVANGPAE